MEVIKKYTEALIIRNKKILLGQRKKVGGFGEGRFAGFGGKVESGETIDQAMCREFFEETGVRVLSFEKRGIIIFHYINDPDMEVSYYEIIKYEGEPVESNEMKPFWFKFEDVPFEKMFENDPHWFPMFLNKLFFTGEYYFDQNYKILKHWIKESNAI